jgi:hypothetical protein
MANSLPLDGFGFDFRLGVVRNRDRDRQVIEVSSFGNFATPNKELPQLRGSSSATTATISTSPQRAHYVVNSALIQINAPDQLAQK